MKEHRLVLEIEGIDAEHGAFRLNAFLQQLTNLRALLIYFDRIVSRKFKPTTYYRVTRLSSSSPAQIELTGMPLKDVPNIANQINERFLSETALIRNKADISDDIDTLTLGAYKKFSIAAGRDFSRVRISFNNTRVDIDEQFNKNLTLILTPQPPCIGSVKGKIEALNLHQTRIFRIYPITGPRSITCYFGTEVLQKVIRAMEENSTVRVHGMLVYKGNRPFPAEIKVRDIDIYPPDEKLPHLLDLCGVAPNATMGKSVKDFIGDLHDEWEG